MAYDPDEPPQTSELHKLRVEALVKACDDAGRDWVILGNEWFISAPKGALDDARAEKLPE